MASFNADGVAVVTVLRHLNNSPDGARPGGPQARLIEDPGSPGTFYGAAEFGSTGNVGAIFKMVVSGGVITSYTAYPISGTGKYPMFRMALDGNGNLYGCCYNGGTFDKGTVDEMTRCGASTVLYQFTGTPDGACNLRADIGCSGRHSLAMLHFVRLVDLVENSTREEMLNYLAQPRVDDDDKVLLLSLAFSRQRSDHVDLLLGLGVPIDGVKGRTTPLLAAVDNASPMLVREVLDRGADVNARNHRGLTPLHLAAALGMMEIVKELVHRGADLNARNRYGETPLMRAAREGCADIVSFLLQAGADKNLVDHAGKTAADHARIGHADDCLVLLT